MTTTSDDNPRVQRLSFNAGIPDNKLKELIAPAEITKIDRGSWYWMPERIWAKSAIRNPHSEIKRGPQLPLYDPVELVIAGN